MTEMSTLEVIEVDDSELDEGELHISCTTCEPYHGPGTIVVAMCGTLYRIRRGFVPSSGPYPDTCKECIEIHYSGCPGCKT